MATKNYLVNDQLDNITLVLAKIAENTSPTSDGQGLYFKNFKTLQMLNRMGLASKVLDSYSYIVVNKETGMTVSAHGSGITGATVDEDAFVAKVGEALTKEYEFIFDGSSWHLDGETALLSTYGITVTGTAAEGDTIVVDETAEAIRYDVIGIDYDIPSDPNLTHTITLQRHDCTAYGSLPYKRAQGLIYVDPDVYPDGIAANTFLYVNAYYCCYDNTTKEDGMYGFTTPVAIPAGGLIKHSALGAYQSSESLYTKQRILGGTWSVYDTIAEGRAQLASGIATVEADGSAGTLLGTVTAENVDYRSAGHLNMTRRNAYGSNCIVDADELVWMNSDAPRGTDAKGVQLWQSGHLGKFDLPSTYNAAGNLHGMDPALTDVIGEVRKRTFIAPADRDDQTVKYVDLDMKVFPISMMEANLGTTNDGVYEGPVAHDGTVTTTPYPYWQRRTTGEERIKRQAGVARHWWLRSPHPSYCSYVRIVHSSGALGNGDASYAFGAADAYCIV